jgi:hypothetical protein
MSVDLIGTFPLGAINVGLDGSITAIVPLLAQFDLMLTGSFGLGALSADLSLQLNAAISLQATLSLQISNPFASLKLQLQAILQIQAGISATLALGLPAVSVQLSASISASAAISASLGIKLGGISLLIKAALAVKLPVVNLVASITAALSAGPFELLSIGFSSADTLASAGSEFNAMCATGFGGIAPTDQVYGVIMLTKSPSASVALSAIIKTS